ncbi:hypothetical protein BD847_2178 [Flavobacterium cutihirudinis]|uniref:Uncharacterized protein n=1 Tax=Flavobacterium cutihirudinis TaxID=1265740 RepID=A0A3D9FXD9_9FLAO|nr:hypothetical protein BD847_2178 [Flavobacterium cutihirudinis]
MLKRVFILGIILTLIQTLIYFIFVELLKFAEAKFVSENERQITDKILPFVILIFFEAVLIQNILSSIINKKLFTWIMFSISTIFLLAPFFKSFSIWPSVPFSFIITLLLLSYNITAKHYNKTIPSLVSPLT